ncbi:MAG: rane protein [Bacteroidetes bacterium]|nr:rane protein [Bacteroidota bacterium]
MKYLRLIPIAILAITFISPKNAEAQIDNDNITETILRKQITEGARVIMTGVPVLLIAPDSRAGSMGDVGAASTPDGNSIHWNAAKLAFAENQTGLTFTYTPWLRDLVGDISLMYLAGYYKLDDRSALGGSLTYFSLGGINFFSEEGQDMGNFKPNEFALDLAYTMKLSDYFSASVTGRYIRSDLTQGQNVGTTATKAANSAATDIGLYYQRDIDQASEYAIGMQISNLGAKISYSDNMEKSFLPANLRLGGRYTMDFDQFNKLSMMLDINKLLVPTPAVYDSVGDIVAGMNPNVGILQGAIQSFYDAPNGFKEEMQEIMLSAGLEYTYNKFLYLRGGYFYESDKKGGRQYATFGGGFKYNVMSLDIAYLVPTVANNHPLKNTLRLSLTFDLSPTKK